MQMLQTNDQEKENDYLLFWLIMEFFIASFNVNVYHTKS